MKASAAMPVIHGIKIARNWLDDRIAIRVSRARRKRNARMARLTRPITVVSNVPAPAYDQGTTWATNDTTMLGMRSESGRVKSLLSALPELGSQSPLTL